MGARLMVVFLIIRVRSVLILRLVTMVVSFILRVGKLIRVHTYVLQVFRRSGRLLRNVVHRLRRRVSVLMLLLNRVLVNLTLTISNAYRIVTTITSTLCLHRFARRNACLRLAFQARTPFKRLVRVVNGLRLRTIASVLMLLRATRRFIRVVVLLHVRRILRRSRRATNAFNGRVCFLTYLRSKRLYHEGRATQSGARTVFLILLLR